MLRHGWRRDDLIETPLLSEFFELLRTLENLSPLFPRCTLNRVFIRCSFLNAIWSCKRKFVLQLKCLIFLSTEFSAPNAAALSVWRDERRGSRLSKKNPDKNAHVSPDRGKVPDCALACSDVVIRWLCDGHAILTPTMSVIATARRPALLLSLTALLNIDFCCMHRHTAHPPHGTPPRSLGGSLGCRSCRRSCLCC